MTDIKDYFLIGDLHSSALVSKNCSIDWLCLPHFDSPSLFAHLLDQDSGSFSINTDGFKLSSKYIENTAVVETTFDSYLSSFKVFDFMVPQPRDHCSSHFLVRKVLGTEGKSQLSFFFNPKPNYGHGKAEFKVSGDHYYIDIGDDRLLLYPPAFSLVREKDGGLEITFEINQNEEKKIIMEYIDKHNHPKIKTTNFLEETIEFWRAWVSKGKYFDYYKKQLIRSAITLKLMQFYPTGALVASPTTSLPEEIGGERNWDYRYVWIRDATFTLYAFFILNHNEEALKFFKFISKVARKEQKQELDISLMCTIWGEKVPNEIELKHMTGYKNSKPVRVGNNATDQLQIDIYGSLLDAYYFYSEKKKSFLPFLSKRRLELSETDKEIVHFLSSEIEKNWKEKDHSIWEIRENQKHYTYSKIMAWVGINRVLRMKEDLNLSVEKIEHLEELEREILSFIWDNCFDRKNQTFKQHPETEHQDASNFLFVLLQFLDKHDPLTEKVIQKTKEELVYDDVFVYRYIAEDGLKGGEGAFLLCSFWYISALAILEKTEEAERLFKKLVKNFAHHGLISEEIDPKNGEYLGNYPQAFSHLGFIMTCYYLDKYKEKKKGILNLSNFIT